MKSNATNREYIDLGEIVDTICMAGLTCHTGMAVSFYVRIDEPVSTPGSIITSQAAEDEVGFRVAVDSDYLW